MHKLRDGVRHGRKGKQVCSKIVWVFVIDILLPIFGHTTVTNAQ